VFSQHQQQLANAAKECASLEKDARIQPVSEQKKKKVAEKLPE